MSNVPTLLLRTFVSPVEMRTPRVLLRQWKESDIEVWCEMNADADVRKYFPKINSREDSLAESDRIRTSIRQRGWGMWALEVPGVHPFAGFVGLNAPVLPHPGNQLLKSVGVCRNLHGIRDTPPKLRRRPSILHLHICVCHK